MELITGYAGKPHVYPADDAAQNRGTITGDNVVLNVDEKFAYELVYNNTIRIKSGTAVFQGRVIRIRANLYDELIIENGTQALIRNDLIVARYTYEEGIESAALTVVKGIPGETGTDPEIYDENNIDQGDTICDMPLYRVVINGLNIESVTPLFKTIKGLKELEQAVNEAITALNNDLTQGLSGKAPSSHKHASADVTDLGQASVKYAQSAGAVAWKNVSDKPDSFPPSSHNHAWSSITNKPSSFSPSAHNHDDRYYTEDEIDAKLSGLLSSSRVVAHSWTTAVNGTSIDVGFSNVGMIPGSSYAIIVNNANRDASNITVLGVSINQAKNQFRIYWDQSFNGNVQFNLVAIRF